MLHKVSDLTGALLDAAVAKAEKVETIEGPSCHLQAWDADHACWRGWVPSEDWRVGGPIIYREQISTVSPDVLGPPHTEWRAEIMAVLLPGRGEHAVMFGPTPLIAAMRAYVASMFGPEVDL